jgi:predicted phage terminase large subunit-like protein
MDSNVITMDPEVDGTTALRIAATDSLITFAELLLPEYKASAVHRLLASKLEQCEAKKIRRLCISIAPRFGKSLLASAVFPAWCLTRNPRLEFIQASYSSELAEGFSQTAKNLLTCETYRSIFPEIVDSQSNRSRDWRTLSGGHVFAAGVGAGGLGRGADILLVDDPIRNREDANSETLSAMLWQWFNSVALTRLSPDGVVIVISTRWGDNDLIGKLTSPERVRELQDAGATDGLFEVLNLPALCDDPATDPLHRQLGESLWPERWSKEKLLEVKATIGSREWAGHYMGRPAAPGGNLCDVSKIQFIERSEVPTTGLRICHGWDLALGIAKQNDYSAGVLVGVDHKTGNVYLIHLSRGKRRWLEQKALIVQVSELEAQESGQNWYKAGIETVAAFSTCFDEVKQALLGKVRVEAVPATESKEGRAQGWFNRIDAGQFFVVRGAWNQDFIDELTQFPNGRHDDQVDGVSIAFSIAGKKPARLLVA